MVEMMHLHRVTMNETHEVPMIGCPFCGGRIREDEVKCPLCNTYLERVPEAESALDPPPAPTVAEQQYSHIQPLWQFALLYICSFGLYAYVWFFRNWLLLNERRGLRIWPAIRTLFAFVFAYSFLREAEALSGRRGPGVTLRSLALGMAFLVINLVANLPGLHDPSFHGQFHNFPHLPQWVSLVQLLAWLPLLPGVIALNRYWAAQEPERPVRTWLSPGALLVISFGGTMLLMTLVELFFPGLAAATRTR